MTDNIPYDIPLLDCDKVTHKLPWYRTISVEKLHRIVRNLDQEPSTDLWGALSIDDGTSNGQTIHIICLMLLHMRGNIVPGGKFPEITHDLFDIYQNLLENMREVDPKFEDLKQIILSAGSSAPTIQGLAQIFVNQDILDTEMPCSICQEVPEADTLITKLPCNHWFHGMCIAPWLWKHRCCPFCRQVIPDKGEHAPGSESEYTNSIDLYIIRSSSYYTGSDLTVDNINHSIASNYD